MQEMLFQRHKFEKLSSGGGRARKEWALLQFCPTTEESLKNALINKEKIKVHLYLNSSNISFLRTFEMIL
jgi:hypothetical protein